MAVRFRKSVKLGPVRLTASRRGLSGSVGVPGARVSANTRGEVRRTVGIPGSGLSDTEVVSTKATRSADRGQGVPVWVWLVVAAAVVVGCLMAIL